MNKGTVGVNSLPKTVTRQRRGCDLNRGHAAPESSTLTSRLPSHPIRKDQQQCGLWLPILQQLANTGVTVGPAVQQDRGQEDRLPHEQHPVHADSGPRGRGGGCGADHEQDGRRKSSRVHVRRRTGPRRSGVNASSRLGGTSLVSDCPPA